MNATTPPKLIPPFHSTAPSGTFPTEQTNDITEINGPTSGSQSSATVGWETRKKPRQNVSGTHAPTAPGDQQPARDVRPHRGPVHHEVMTYGRETVGGGEPREERSLADNGHVHLGVPFHPTHPTPLGLALCLGDHRSAEGYAEQPPQKHDHDRAADEFGRRELPAEEDGHDDAEFDDQVGRGEFEYDGRGEVAPLRKSDRANATAA
jgi:hypothetical protein